MEIITPKSLNIIIPRIYNVWYKEHHDNHEKFENKLLYILKNGWVLQFISVIRQEYNEIYDVDVNDEYIYFEVYNDNKLIKKMNVYDKGEWITPEYFKNNFILEEYYKYCKCSELIFIDNKCKDCYIWNYINDERCCVCFETDGCWVQLVCKHAFHPHCVENLDKCPLCRAPKEYFNLHYGFDI